MLMAVGFVTEGLVFEGLPDDFKGPPLLPPVTIPPPLETEGLLPTGTGTEFTVTLSLISTRGEVIPLLSALLTDEVVEVMELKLLVALCELLETTPAFELEFDGLRLVFMLLMARFPVDAIEVEESIPCTHTKTNSCQGIKIKERKEKILFQFTNSKIKK